MSNYLNKFGLIAIFDFLYQCDFKKIDIDKIQLTNLSKEINGYNFFNKGDLGQYLIEPFKRTQPKIYNILKDNCYNFFYAIKKTDLPTPYWSDITQFGVLVNDIAIYIGYSPHSNKDNKTIPLDILNSWLLHSSGWDIAEESTISVFKGCLPSMKLNPIHSIISDFEEKKPNKLYCDFLEKKFNHIFLRDYSSDEYMPKTHFELRCLLDTRPSEDYSKTGFQLFVSSHNKERNVYVVPNADVFQIKQLENPADAIDSYAEHIFLKKEGEFDFMQYAKDF